MKRPWRRREQGVSSARLTPRAGRRGALAIDDEGVLMLPDGQLRGVLELDSLNLASYSPDEQDTLADLFAGVAAALLPGQTLQIVVESQPVQAAQVLAEVFAHVQPRAPALAAFTTAWRPWLEERCGQTHVPDLHFYAVFSPATERPMGTTALKAALLGKRPDQGEARRDLEQASRDLTAAFKSMNLGPRRLRGAAMRRLVASHVGPQLRLTEELDALVTDAEMAASLYVLQLPHRTTPGWLRDLIALDCPYRLAIHLEGRDRYAERKRLERKRRGFSLATRADSRQRGLSSVDATRAQGEMERQIDDLLGDPHNAIVRMGLYLTLFASSRGDLRERVARARALIRSRLGAEVAWARGAQLPLWRSTLPLGVDVARFRQRTRTETVGNSLPFLSHNPGTRTGYPLGFTQIGHELALLNLAESSLPNALCNVIGKTSSGKTFLVQKLLLWTLLTGGRVTIVDRSPGHYETLRAVVGGVTARMADASPRTINIWDRGGGETTPARKIAFVLDAHEILLRDPGHPLDGLQKALLEEGIREVYAGHPDGSAPLESELVAWLHAAAGRHGDAAKRTALEDMAYRLQPYVGEGQYAALVDRPTSVDMDSPLLIFDLEDLPAPLYAFALFAAAEALDRRAKRRSQREGTDPAVVREALVIDEGWFILKYAGAGAWIDELARKGRHWGMVMFFISQQLSDTTDDPHAASLITQGSVRFLFRQDEAPSRSGAGGLSWLATALSLSPVEARQIQRLGGVEREYTEMFLWRDNKHTGARRGVVTVIAHPLEYWLFVSGKSERLRRDRMIAACGGDVWAAIQALASDEENSGQLALDSTAGGLSPAAPTVPESRDLARLVD